MCSIADDLRKSPNPLVVNCVPLLETIVSGTPNLAKFSCKKFIVTVEVGHLHFNISGHIV